MADFIATEPFKEAGFSGEKWVWNQLQKAFNHRDCIAYWRYPIFPQVTGFRKEPDILILDKEWGIIVIEVKSIQISNLIQIDGHRWYYQKFYQSYGNPYQQAEKQLFSLFDYLKNEPILRHKVRGKVLIALPQITIQDWQLKKFDRLPSNPPILFKNNLENFEHIINYINLQSTVISGKPLSENEWSLLVTLITGKPKSFVKTYRNLSSSQSRGTILEKRRSHLFQFDQKQEKIGKQVPAGCQCIRGIAGSGKTVILCQKAAMMHLKYPDWKIALVFFSRSLYQTICQQVDYWLKHFSQNQVKYDAQNHQLMIFHAWGSKEQLGFYRYLCQVSNIHGLSVDETSSQKPNEALAEACIHLLEQVKIPQLFDAILIDEGQDLMVDQPLFQGKQPFYWLAYQALRPINPVEPQQRRLIWTYDELQSLNTLKIPTAREILGDELGHLTIGNYREDIQKSELMSRCYRTPAPILLFAHAISMGLLRSQGILTGIIYRREWEMMGYKVEGELKDGAKVTLKSCNHPSSNLLTQLDQGKLIKFKAYDSRYQELWALSQQIRHNLRVEGLRPSQDILVIVLGNYFEASRLEIYVANFLKKQGIDIYFPSAIACNQIPHPNDPKNPNQFWYEGAVTLSRVSRAKGNEAAMVYIVGLDYIAQTADEIAARNQLFIALTRTVAWVNLSGIGRYPFYEEMRQSIDNKGTLSFIHRSPLKREIAIAPSSELLSRYALGGRNFAKIDLNHAQLAGVNLSQANFIGSNFEGINLENACLEGTKLICANLAYSNLAGASLRHAKLMEANLQGANLIGADLSYADLRGANLTDALIDENHLPEFSD